MSIQLPRPQGLGVFFLVTASCFLADMQPGVAAEISWRIEDNFRLLKNPIDQNRLLQSSNDQGRVPPSSKHQDWIKNLAIQSQNPQSASLGIMDLSRKWTKVPPTYYDPESGKYDPKYISPTEWTVRLSLPHAPYGSQCLWRVGSQMFRGSCHDFIPGIKVGKGPTLVTVNGPYGLAASTQVEIKDVLFAVLGDSYISGEGNPDVFRDGQQREALWWDRKCHRSLYAWPILAAARYAVDHPQKSVAVVSRACSGAILSDLLNIPGQDSYKNQNTEEMYLPRLGVEKTVRVDGLPELKPQIAQLSKDLCLGTWIDDPRGKDNPNSKGDPLFKGEGECHGVQRKPDFIFLSIGGNDAKFAPLIINALVLKINNGNILQKAGENTDTLFESVLRRLLPILKSEIKDFKNEAVSTVQYLENYYPKMVERLYRSFQGAPTIMALYPDPLHSEPTAFCGRNSVEELSVRDDGIPTVDFTAYGMEDVVARLLKRRITNDEVKAIHRNFYLPFVGREPLSLEGLDSEQKEKAVFTNNEYRGLLSIGRVQESVYPGAWYVVPTSRYYPQPDSPFDVVTSDPGASEEYKPRDVHQLPGYYARGYCVSGVRGTGRWFNTVSDSMDRQGSPVGAMHPNIYGQLYYVSKIYPKLEEVDDIKIQSSSSRGRSPSVCPVASELFRKRNKIVSFFEGEPGSDVGLKKLKDIADKSYRPLEQLRAQKENATKRYEASRYDYSGRSRYAPKLPSDAGRNEWGTDQWGRQDFLEYKHIAAYNQAKAEWLAKMTVYESAYIGKIEALAAFDKAYAHCSQHE